jgi:alginate O-acetyltransferase complex protein AlgJ
VVTTGTRHEAHEARSGDADAPAAPASRRRRRPTRRPVAMLIAFLFFFGPAMAFLVGVRPQAIENRALTALPSVSDGWKFFPSFTSWAVDHLPLRAQAISANAKVSEKVFGEAPSFNGDTGGPIGGTPGGAATKASPYPRVIQGKNGWLYFGADIANACQPTASVADTLAKLNRLAHAVQASGRRFVLAIAPDKSTVYPDALPDTYAGKSCAEARRSAFWAAVAKNPPAGYVDLKTPLLAEQKRSGVPVYRQTDTHWGPMGAAIYAEKLAAALDPALLKNTSIVAKGTSTRNGDLGNMISAPHLDSFPDVEVQRPGVTPVGRSSLTLPAMPYSPQTFTDKTTGASLFTPKTLLLGDSFSSASGPSLGGLFAHVTLLHNETSGPYPQAVANLMSDSDVVVIEVVERTIASGRGSLISDASLSAIEKTLAAHHR